MRPMTSQYQHWLDSGGHWRNAIVIGEYVDMLHPHCTNVAAQLGALGNEAHLKAVPPEDHTPYSATGWPIETPRGVVTAIDYSGPEWQAFTDRQIRAARAGNAPWWKYINDGRGGQYTHWDGFTIRHPSNDLGHFHGSVRSDWCARSTGKTTVELWELDGTNDPPIPSVNLTEAIMQRWPVVKRGDTNDHVGDVQSLANRHGANLKVDNDFGPATETWVKGFQAAQHIPNSLTASGQGDGQVGEHTLAALLRLQ